MNREDFDVLMAVIKKIHERLDRLADRLDRHTH